MLKQDRKGAIDWARDVLADDQAVIFDTETTGLDEPEIIEIAIIDTSGNVLMNQRVKPAGEIEAGAQNIHGITPEDLADCPGWADIDEQVLTIFRETSRIIVYNVQFDWNAWGWSRIKAGVNDGNEDRYGLGFQCAMEEYAVYCRQWSDYHKSYRWQRLPGGDHSALGDALATLEVIRAMADSKTEMETDHE